MKKKKEYIKNIIVFIFSFCFTILITITILTLWIYSYNENSFKDAQRIYPKVAPIPFQPINDSYTGEITLNSEGFRDKEYSFVPETNTTRIIIIGDSFTFGVGIKNLSDTYPKRVENLLNRNQNSKYEVLNFGKPGGNIMDIYWILKFIVPKYNPDIVIYGWVFEDTEFQKRNLHINYCNMFEKTPIPLLKEIIISKLVNIKNKKIKKIQQLNFYKEDYYGWTCSKNIIREMAKESNKNKYNLILFYLPINMHLNEIDNKIMQLIFEETDKSNILTIDEFTSDFWSNTTKFSNSDFRVDLKNNDQHYNELPNDIFAKSIYNYLTSEYET